MLDDLATELMSKSDNHHVFKDPCLTPEMANQPISENYLKQIRALLNKTLDDDELLLHWFAQFMTQPKYPDLVDKTEERRVATIDTSTGIKSYCNAESD
jgi:50S ribosomal protein L16 3-hydroxylase